MMTGERAADRIRDAFSRRFSHLALRLPDEDLRERRGGSLPYGGSGRLRYVFGRDGDREYLEYYAYHLIDYYAYRRMGASHGRIYDDGTSVALPELCSTYGYDPKVPGDRERRAAEMHARYRETRDDLIAKGLFDDDLAPVSR